jgi:putative tRNA adenosine deaminase-associated protein
MVRSQLGEQPSPLAVTAPRAGHARIPGFRTPGDVCDYRRTAARGEEAGVAEDGFAVAVYREGGRWDCALLPPAVLEDLDTAVAVLRQQPPEGGPVALLDVADEFFVALRLGPGGTVRALLSDITAAADFPLAQQALDLVGDDSDDEPVDPEEVWPAGDLGIFSDLGLDERALGLILDDVDLWADEMLSAVADRIGVGAQFARLLDTLQPAD